jgi:hypothetical protein
LIARFGGVPGDAGDTQVRIAEQAAAYEASTYQPMIRVGRAGQGSKACAFAIEQEHEEGSRDEVLRRLSAGTTVVSVAYDRVMTELRGPGFLGRARVPTRARVPRPRPGSRWPRNA